METRNILIIDDSETDRQTLRRFLSRDPGYRYQFTECETVESGLGALVEEKPCCVLLDFSLPDGTALDFIESVKAAHGQLDVPIVIQTGTGSQADAVNLMKAGANDYLVKSDVTPEALRLAVNNAIYRVRMARIVEDQQEELKQSFAEVRAARDAAELANAAKDEFLSLLSHELRTPLTPVLSVVSAALTEPGLSPDLRETFQIIRRNIQVEARLIDDLLDLTRVLEGRLQISRGSVDIHACIRDAAELVGALVQSKQIKLEFDLTSPVPTVDGDHSRLQQLFWTVLKNASEFSPAQGNVKVSTRRESGMVVVEIRDWGTGISEEQITRIFDSFQSPGGQRFGALGIGLSIARSIADAHGGTLNASSNGLGHGSAFILKLPENGTLKTVSNAGVDGVHGRTVLVVEDHDDTRRVVGRALRRRGYNVIVAENVARARSQLDANLPDLLICDIGLPDGTGWDVIQYARPIGKLKAIAVTGYGMQSDIERSISSGFDAHVTKPIEFQRLEEVIEEVFAKAAPDSAPDGSPEKTKIKAT